MNYVIQFPLSHPIKALRFLAPHNKITDNITDALIFPTATKAGEALDAYVDIFTDTYSISVIIRPTNLESLPSHSV